MLKTLLVKLITLHFWAIIIQKQKNKRVIHIAQNVIHIIHRIINNDKLFIFTAEYRFS